MSTSHKHDWTGDHCDECGVRVCNDLDCDLSYGWASDGALLCNECLASEIEYERALRVQRIDEYYTSEQGDVRL